MLYALIVVAVAVGAGVGAGVGALVGLWLGGQILIRLIREAFGEVKGGGEI